jgi:hypothetical protein
MPSSAELKSTPSQLISSYSFEKQVQGGIAATLIVRLNDRLSLRRHLDMLFATFDCWRGKRSRSKFMDNSTQGCRDEIAKCLRLMKSAPSKDQAEILRNISMSWSRLAGQIDRYNQLAREQSRVPRAGAISLEQLKQRISVGGRDLTTGTKIGN